MIELSNDIKITLEDIAYIDSHKYRGVLDGNEESLKRSGFTTDGTFLYYSNRLQTPLAIRKLSDEELYSLYVYEIVKGGGVDE